MYSISSLFSHTKMRKQKTAGQLHSQEAKRKYIYVYAGPWAAHTLHLSSSIHGAALKEEPIATMLSDHSDSYKLHAGRIHKE